MIELEKVSKKYRLGTISSTTFQDEIKRKFFKNKYKIIDQNQETIEKDHVWALKNINFKLEKGEVLGIIGKNGAGKSTILKLLSKVTKPSEGSITINGKLSSLLEVGTGFHNELTGRENIYLNGAILGMKKKEIHQKIDDIISFSGCEEYIDTPVKRYSSGMTVRLAFSVAAHLEPDILIVDEVLAVGDIEFQEKCLGKMKEVSGQGRTIIFVSHDMGAIKTLCNRCIVLNKGEIHFEGNTSDAINEYVKLNTNKNINDGSIDPKYFMFYNGKLDFNKISLYNHNNETKKNFNYHEKFNIKIDFKVNEEISDLIITLTLKSREGSSIFYGTTIDHDPQNLFNLKIGNYSIVIENKNILIPGDFYISINATNKNGVSYCLVENAIDFKINRVGTSNLNSYKWVNSNGYAVLNANWKLKTKNNEN
tara:strand:- start:935 stop:2203 length:1269 start_codon:yes stop_codon:yes gene_type:complete